MLPALIIVFREGFEAFLIVAIIFAYLRKTERDHLRPAVYWGIFASVLTSAGLGYLLMRVNQPMWEGVFGIIAIVMVTSFVIHLWRTAPMMKKDMETRLHHVSSKGSTAMASAGVFFFTLFMITREGMETALMLMQVRTGRFALGVCLGLLGAALISWSWAHYGHLIDVRRFFQVTGIFLLLFAVQIAIYSVHEFSEAGVFPNSEALHLATEPYSPVGVYGRWFSVIMIGLCACWLAVVTIADKVNRSRNPEATA